MVISLSQLSYKKKMTFIAKNFNKYKVMSFIFVFTVIFGNYAIVDIHILGVVPTYYRVMIPVLFIFVILKERKFLKEELIQENFKIVKFFYAIVLFWILYGAVSLFLSPWSAFNIGAREILALVLAAMSVYVVSFLVKKECFYDIITAIKIAVIVLLIIGFVETVTGKHLGTSMWNDSDYIDHLQEIYKGDVIPKEARYIATGIFYNPNDYCAFLSVFSPVFLFYKKEDTKAIVGNYAILFFVFIIFIIDDAWICIVAILLGIIVYFLVVKASIGKYLLMAGVFICARYGGGYLVEGISACLYKIFKYDIFDHTVRVSGVETAVITQVDNMAQDQGSLFFRINTYLESISEMFIQSKGLGLGAGSFTNYFSGIAEQKNMMSNPHSFWVEILVQYGVVIFMLFVAILVVILCRLIMKIVKEDNKIYAVIIAMGTAFIFASFAPSSYLTNSYYWLPIGLALGVLANGNNTNPRSL